jgi:hypothetical protein
MVATGPDPARQVLRDQLAARLRDPVLAGERLHPVGEAFAGLLPGHGLRRGSVVAVAVTGSHALALVAKASQAGSWVTAVGLDDLGILAAHEFGLVLERLALVPLAISGPRYVDEHRQRLIVVFGASAGASGIPCRKPGMRRPTSAQPC